MMFRKTFLYYQRICQNLRPNVTIFNILYLYGEELADHPTLELEDCLLLDVHSGFFNIFTATHHVWRLYVPCTALGHSVPQCIQLNYAVQNLMISSMIAVLNVVPLKEFLDQANSHEVLK